MLLPSPCSTSPPGNSQCFTELVRHCQAQSCGTLAAPHSSSPHFPAYLSLGDAVAMSVTGTEGTVPAHASSRAAQ